MYFSRSWHTFADRYGSNWKWPDIPGLHSFNGDLFHSANYKENYDLTGKRVAVIGNGSSGIQVVAEAYKHASKLYTWVRSPTWIIAAIGQKKGSKEGQNFECMTFSLT